MFSKDKKKHTLFLKRQDIEATLNFDPQEGMMFQRQLPEYLQYLSKKGENIFRVFDKKLLLVGGACSNIRYWLDKIGIEMEVTNIDFYCEPNPCVSNHHIKKDFYDWSIRQNYYDQEWALWSLPAYSFSKQEVDIFFVKASLGLAQNGILRVFPLNRGPGNMGTSNKEYTNEERLKDSINILKFLTKIGFQVQNLHPKEMESIFQIIETKKTQLPYIISSLFKTIDAERINYVKNELVNYQNKENAKTPFLVIITAPKDIKQKKLVNKKLVEFLKIRKLHEGKTF